jgi:hypothetical protein
VRGGHRVTGADPVELDAETPLVLDAALVGDVPAVAAGEGRPPDPAARFVVQQQFVDDARLQPEPLRDAQRRGEAEDARSVQHEVVGG